MVIDTHAHIIDEKYRVSPRVIVQNALDAGVRNIIHVGCDKQEIVPAIHAANEFECVYAAIGIHPIYANGFDQEAEDLIREYVKHPKVVAIGEIGLDYHWKTSTKEEQVYAFRKQLDMAIEFDKPVIIHTREAMQDTYDILAEYKGRIRGILHCYSGSYEMAKRFIELGFLISLAGPVTYKNARESKEVAQRINLNHLLVETDCPYLSPEPYRGTINEPKNVVEVAKYIAGLRDVPYEMVAEATTANAKRIFNIK